MKVAEIYRKYKIPPNLQLHMYRVAAVAWTICDNFEDEVDKENIIAADLLHDMGNIIKFDFDVFPEFYKPEDRKYWEDIQAEFKKKYRNDEHFATMEIAEEIKVPERVKDILYHIGTPKTETALNGEDEAKWIANYADYRVAPHGIVSLDERLADGRKRYVNRKTRKLTNSHIDYIDKVSHELENLIKRKTKINLDSITDLTVSDKIKQLQNFKIPTKL